MNLATKKLRQKILRAAFESQAGHIPSAFSILEIIYLLYNNYLSEEDVFVLSKGHGCLALYAVFLHMGYLTEEEFYSFTRYDSKLGGHPHRGKHPKIYASTGSLGHGLPICVGTALAKKIAHADGKVFCLVGDGECNEGSIWESAMIADNLKLDNLICIVDDNSSQIRSLPSKGLASKFRSFGWRAIEVADGHSLTTLALALEQARCPAGIPTVLVCKTVKGKGVPEMEENMFAWHHGPPNEEQYKRFCEGLSA
jgi:transketolase